MGRALKNQHLIWVAGLLWVSLQSASGLMCYICGQHELPEPAECSTQFQYDCSSYARRYPEGTKILCRTTRQKYGNDTFTVQKECVSANDHRFTFPGGDLNGCDHFYDDKGFEISYCLCDQDFCNKPPLHEQEAINREMSSHGADMNPPTANANDEDARFLDLPAPGQKRNFSVGTNVNIRQEQSELGVMKLPVDIPIEPTLADEIPDEKSGTLEIAQDPVSVPEWEPKPEPSPDTVELGPSIVDVAVADSPGATESPLNLVVEPPILSTDQPRLREIPTYKMKPMHLNTQPTAGSVSGLVCHVCAETNVEGENPECSQQHAVDCSSQYPKGVQTYCFSRVSFLDNGKSTVEKLCTSDLAVMQEYGDEAIVDGCSSTWEGRVNFCVCSTDKCNEMTVAEQFRGEKITRDHIMAVQGDRVVDTDLADSPTNGTGPVVPVHDSHPPPPTAAPLVGASKCYVCGETDLAYPADCADMYQYDCSLAYAPATHVLCLTRQTKLPTGMFAIEKRCISEEQHKQQYPGADITLNGCGNAWNGYVEYCVCQSDYCNQQNLTGQQISVGVQPVNAQTPPPPSTQFAPPPSTHTSSFDETPEIKEEELKDGMGIPRTQSQELHPKDQMTEPVTISQAQPQQPPKHPSRIHNAERDPLNPEMNRSEPETFEDQLSHESERSTLEPSVHRNGVNPGSSSTTMKAPSQTRRRPPSAEDRGPTTKRPRNDNPRKMSKPSISPQLGSEGFSTPQPLEPQDENKVGYALSAAKQNEDDENSGVQSIPRFPSIFLSLLSFIIAFYSLL